MAFRPTCPVCKIPMTPVLRHQKRIFVCTKCEPLEDPMQSTDVQRWLDGELRPRK